MVTVVIYSSGPWEAQWELVFPHEKHVNLVGTAMLLLLGIKLHNYISQLFHSDLFSTLCQILGSIFNTMQHMSILHTLKIILTCELEDYMYLELVNHVLAFSFTMTPSAWTMTCSKEHVKNIERRMKSTHVTAAIQCFLSSFIINFPFLLIWQDLISMRNLLEL